VHADATDKAAGLQALSATPRGAARPEATEHDAPITTGLLTAAQVAERWQVPVRTVYAWANRNAIPHHLAGRLLRFDPVEVEEQFRCHGFADEVAADPEKPGALYAGFGDGKILHSPDAGESWDEVADVPALDALVAVRA
jgi:excisionase family DNA binding protein